MDPIFSAGVFLAMWSGKLAAEVVLKSLERRQPSRATFAAYEKRVRRGLRFYWRVVENYYTTPFMEIFLRPSNHYDLPSAVNAVLAGELEGGWSLRWRLEYFFLLVKIQRYFPIVPRIFFGASRPRKLNPIPQPGKDLKPTPCLPRARHALLLSSGILALVGCLLCVSCRTATPLPPADFSAPGWRLRQGQAVWKPSKDRPELAGDLLLAANANGRLCDPIFQNAFYAGHGAGGGGPLAN